VQALTQQLWLIRDSAHEPFRPLVAAILIHSSRLGSLAIWKRKRVSPMEKKKGQSNGKEKGSVQWKRKRVSPMGKNKGKGKGCKEFCVN
jgi:hypothetical protein